MSIKKNLKSIEYASISLSMIGTVTAIVTGQIAYIAAPLTLSLSLGLIDRQKQLTRANHRFENLEQQSKLVKDSLTALPATPTAIDFNNLEKSIIADRQQIKHLSTALSNLKQQDNDLTPFLTEIDVTKDSIKQLTQDFSNFQAELNIRQDSTRVTTTDLVLEKFDRSNRSEIDELIDAVITDRKIHQLIQIEVDRLN